MKIEVDGIQYFGWTEASANIRLDTLSNEFNFKATSQEGKPLPFKGGESCSIYVSDEKILTGSIEIVNIDGDSNSHTITVAGRDKTGDLLDSKIGSISDIRPVSSLKTIIEGLIKHLGNDIEVTENYTPELFRKSEDLAAPEPGQPAWDFIENLARKRQVLLSSDGDGNVLIARAQSEEIEVTLQNKINDDANNVLSYSVSYDRTGRYNVYRISSQLNPVAIVYAGRVANSAIVSQNAQQLDPDIRPGRQFVIVAENAGSNPLDRAKWEANVRKARGKVYGATMDGFRNETGELWQVNKLVQVVDEFVDINSRMLINSVNFSADISGGRNTTLSLVEKNAYSLTLEEPSTDKVGVNT